MVACASSYAATRFSIRSVFGLGDLHCGGIALDIQPRFLSGCQIRLGFCLLAFPFAYSLS